VSFDPTAKKYSESFPQNIQTMLKRTTNRVKKHGQLLAFQQSLGKFLLLIAPS
jgi:hypothetical protein